MEWCNCTRNERNCTVIQQITVRQRYRLNGHHSSTCAHWLYIFLHFVLFMTSMSKNDKSEHIPNHIRTLCLCVYVMGVCVSLYRVLRVVYCLYAFYSCTDYEAFNDIGTVLIICQIFSFLEVIHPLVGLVKTSFVPPLMQVSTVHVWHQVLTKHTL